MGGLLQHVDGLGARTQLERSRALLGVEKALKADGGWCVCVGGLLRARCSREARAFCSDKHPIARARRSLSHTTHHQGADDDELPAFAATVLGLLDAQEWEKRSGGLQAAKVRACVGARRRVVAAAAHCRASKHHTHSPSHKHHRRWSSSAAGRASSTTRFASA